MSDTRGVLLVNLGTPGAPTRGAVFRYLAQFLSDPRVIESPSWWWKPLLYGVILPVRSGASAKKYRSIWTPEGSPLAVETASQAEALQRVLGPGVLVEWAMRYQNPSVAAAWRCLRNRGCRHLTVIPLFPQVSGATVASVFDAVSAALARERHPPTLRFVSGFHGHGPYQTALASSVQRHWDTLGRPDHLLMSYHGLPLSFVRRGDPYARQCRETSVILAENLGLSRGQWTQSFQSRFGRQQWLGPTTLDQVVKQARSGVRRLDVVCPSFVSDCLETLEEINGEVRDAFLAAGGREFRLIPCLGDDEAFMAALAHLAGPP